jgi:hypothetical protein
MNTQTFLALSILNDLKSTAYDTLLKRHKIPALILFYSFIDICSKLTHEGGKGVTNEKRFINYLTRYSRLNWQSYAPTDLWAARCSLLHAYSPLGDRAKKPDPPISIFYYAWPEKKETVHEAITARGYSNFYVMDIKDINLIANRCFNAFWHRVENDEAFELTFRNNAEHLLKDFSYMQLENELTFLDQLKAESNDGEQS